MEFQVILTTNAGRDLEEIGRYIAVDDLEAAERFCKELFQAAKSLTRLPQRGQVVNRSRNVRRFIHKSYLIFYKIDEETRRVDILRFWHAAQNPRRLRLRESAARYAVPVDQA